MRSGGRAVRPKAPGALIIKHIMWLTSRGHTALLCLCYIYILHIPAIKQSDEGRMRKQATFEISKEKAERVQQWLENHHWRSQPGTPHTEKIDEYESIVVMGWKQQSLQANHIDGALDLLSVS